MRGSKNVDSRTTEPWRNKRQRIDLTSEEGKPKPIEVLREPGRIVLSDGYSDFAPSLTFQQFLIQGSTEQHVNPNISDFDCSSDDKLVFYDGPTLQGRVLQGPCGSSVLVRFFRSASESVYVIFATENTSRVSRWRFSYDCVRKDGFGDQVITP